MGNRCRTFNRRDLDQFPGHERLSESDRERLWARRGYPGPQGREHEIARELLPNVEHMGTNGAGRQRAITDLLQVPSLSKIQRERHDVSAVHVRQAMNVLRHIAVT